MSKKLIAVASAAALALSALVAAPASAAAFSVSLNGDVGAGGDIGLTSATAAEANIPTLDVLRYGTANDTTTGSVVRVDVTTTAVDKTVSVTTTGGVKVLTAAQWASSSVTKNSKAGATSVSAATETGTSGAAFYLFTTSTSAGTAVFTQDGNSRTVYLKGINPVAYNLNFSTTATADIDGEIEFTGTVTDAFGNKITGLTETNATSTGLSKGIYSLSDEMTVTGFGGAASAVTASSWEEAEDADGVGTGTYTFTVAAGDTAGNVIIGLKHNPATAVKVTALGTPKATQFFTVSVSSLADQVTALNTAVAALKADYNALAAKWNKRVASKTAPKKKVALK
jgi:hypothetical protein